jgi:hypothetical protein
VQIAPTPSSKEDDVSTLNPSSMAIFADDPKAYEGGNSGEDLSQLIDEDAYDAADFAADASSVYDTEELEQDEVALDDVADENDYSHAEGDPDAVEASLPSSASEELEDYERGDPS